MGRIKRLERSVIDKIAAGEIVERPASVVKELVENSIDAGASSITVEIEQGGRKLIRVTDDGEGILPDDLPLAVQSHATSKLTDPSDLERVGTLGFRGEALASIASVSEMSIASRPRSLSYGARLTVRFGGEPDLDEIGMAPGTVVEVRDLFRNLPVRLKFMRSASTEASHVHETLVRFALAYPAISFRLAHGSRATLSAPPAADELRRIREFFGTETAEAMVPVEHEEPGYASLRGYVSLPPLARSNSRSQYVFLNGRYIRDRNVQSAISEAYRGKLLQGQYPVVFLFLVMSPSLFDVNVHPTKIEVRFLHQHRVFSLVHAALSAALDAHGGPLQMSPAVPARPAEPPAEIQERVKRSIFEHYREGGGSRPAAPFPPSSTPGAPAPAVPPPAPAESPEDMFGWRYLGSLGDAYLLFAEGDDLVAVDQHALHERILYEEILARGGELPVQRLLIPHSVELTPAEYAVFEEAAEELKAAGFEVEPFGGRTVAVHAVPQGFPLDRVGEALQRSVAELSEEKRKGEPLAQRLLKAMACKAAVKAGEKLSLSEIRALVERYRAIEGRGETCPHGRPAVVKIPFAAVGRWFKRS